MSDTIVVVGVLTNIVATLGGGVYFLLRIEHRLTKLESWMTSNIERRKK